MMNDRNLFRLAMLAVALFVAIEASPTGASMPDPMFGAGNGEVTTLAAKNPATVRREGPNGHFYTPQ
jgi:hypothetical protein